MLYLWLLLFTFQNEVPLKPADEFECKLSLSFKTRSYANEPLVDYTETVAEHEKRLANSPLPYLKMNLSFLKLSEMEVRAVFSANDNTLKSKKVVAGDVMELDFGFTDDIKDGVSPREYEVILKSKDRKAVSKITISFTKEGDYMLNGVKRGRI